MFISTHTVVECELHIEEGLNFAFVTAWLGSSYKIAVNMCSLDYDNLIKHRNHEVMIFFSFFANNQTTEKIKKQRKKHRKQSAWNNEITYVNIPHDKNFSFHIHKHPMKWIFHTCMSFFIIQRLLSSPRRKSASWFRVLFLFQLYCMTFDY